MNTPPVPTFLGITLSILFIWLPSLFAGLAPDTKITTPTHMVCVESLKVGNTICGYRPTTHAFPDVTIKNIEPVLVENIYVITTKHGTITASADQLFYEITSESFIPAKQLKPGQLFLTKEIKALECISVEHKNIQTTVYDLTLEEPHLFFSSNAQVLTHNAVPILLLGIPVAAPVIKFVASVGAIAGALYIEKIATSSLPIFKQCREQRERKAARQAFLTSLNQNQAEEHPTPSNKPQTPPQPIIENTTPSGGQAPDPNDPKNKNESPIIIRGKGMAPKLGQPNSIYEKLDNENPDIVVSRTIYNSDGKPEIRDDFYRGSNPHTHFDEKTEVRLKDHRHIFKYNSKGQIISRPVVGLNIKDIQ